MKKIMLIGLLSLLTSNVYAGTFPLFNDEVLTGVKTFDAKLRLVIWDETDPFREDLSLPEKERFQTQANDAFVLGLRRDGVTVNDASLDTLYCDINASIATGFVTFDLRIDYWSWDITEDGVHKLLWEDRLLSGIGFDNFNAEVVAKSCQDLFAKEWLKWNPK